MRNLGTRFRHETLEPTREIKARERKLNNKVATGVVCRDGESQEATGLTVSNDIEEINEKCIQL